MLSAVAARKARLQSESSSSVPASPPPVSISAAQSKKLEVTKNKPPLSKRKTSGHGKASIVAKKPRRSKGKDTPRYFVEPEPESISMISDSDVSVAMDEESADGLMGFVESQPRLPTLGRRAYSPSRPIEDSSDEDVALELSSKPTLLTAPSTEPVALSSFDPRLNKNLFSLPPEERISLNLSDGPSFAAILSPSDTMSFIGTVTIRVLLGTVSLLGSTLRASPTFYPVFAPKTSPVPVLEVTSDRGESSRASSNSIPERFKRSLRDGGAIVVFQKLQTGIEGLGRVVRTFDGFLTPSADDNVEELPISNVYLAKSSSRDLRPFKLPATWSLALDEIEAMDLTSPISPPICFVKGPRNTGKSSFAQILTNRLLSRYRRVAYLDCDLGQSEFTPGGMVALTVIEQPLLGPSFTHPTVPYQAHFVGSSSPRTSPSHYLSSVEALIHTYRLDIQHNSVFDTETQSDDLSFFDMRIVDNIPLVVNTMGWTKGLGADLTHKIEQIILPTFTFVLDATNSTSELATATVDGPPPRVLSAIPSPVFALRQTAADYRALALLSYFHAVFPVDGRPGTRAERWETRVPLCSIPPFELDITLSVSRFVINVAGAEDVVQEEAFRVLNGALVALVRTDDDTEAYTLPSTETGGLGWTLPCDPGASPPDPSSSTCMGLALIRGIAPSLQQLHLLTPLPGAGARTFVKGELELPIWGMLDHTAPSLDIIPGAEPGQAPFLRWGNTRADGVVGGEKRRIRRNLMRKGQM